MSSDFHGYASRGDAAWLYPDSVDNADWIDGADYSSLSARDELANTIGRAFHLRMLQEIARLSQNYPGLSLILTESKVFIPSAVVDGFDASIETVRGRYVVSFAGWSDEFALVGEAVELLEAALLGEIRLRLEIGAQDRRWKAEKRLVNGTWVKLPRHGELDDDTQIDGRVHTKVLRNSYLSLSSYAVTTARRSTRAD